MLKKPLWLTVWTQIRLLCSGSTLLAPILNASAMLGNYLQQTTSAGDIFRCIFLGALRVKYIDITLLFNRIADKLALFVLMLYVPVNIFSHVGTIINVLLKREDKLIKSS